MRYRAQRKRSRIPTVALVGYTNAGKSTLLNTITKSDVYVADQLFATLDPTTRRVELPADIRLFSPILLASSKYPYNIMVESFHATLEESLNPICFCTLWIFRTQCLEPIESVQQTLEELGANHIPIVTALNKVDQLRDPEAARQIVSRFSKAVTISAWTGRVSRIC